MPFTDLFNKAYIDEQVNITPTDLNKNLDNIILQKLKNKLEGYCTQFGYIQEVIRIESKEENAKLNDNGTGDCVIKVKIEVDRCLPEKDQIIECKITADDEHMGVYISYEEPIFISIINTTEDELQKDDIIKVKVEDFQLKHGDSIINIMSSYVKEDI
jgi:DNA-directed RNA polymerase subunit E'/Rpb7